MVNYSCHANPNKWFNKEKHFGKSVSLIILALCRLVGFVSQQMEMHFSVCLVWDTLFYFYRSGVVIMKKILKYALATLLVISLICNGLLCYYIHETEKPVPSITRLCYDMHDTVIYCEKSADINTIQFNQKENSFTIGKSKITCEEDSVYFTNDEKRIRLADYEGFGFVINSEGELLYSMNTPVKKQEKVFITPSGEKYHRNQYCAGKSRVEVPIETAQLLREPCSLCA